MSTKGARPIIRIVKKKAHAHAHHGGSWKIAYADFVTAMMAFFMVMWLLGLSDDVKKAIQAYFSDPVGMQQAYSRGSGPIAAGAMPSARPQLPIRMFSRAAQQHAFFNVAEKLRQEAQKAIKEERLGMNVEVSVEKSGLRIELSETGEGAGAYAIGSATMTNGGRRVLRLLANQLQMLPNSIVIEGHTDSHQYANSGYDNWKLSVNRADQARTTLVGFGVQQFRVSELRGKADRELRVPTDPFAASNRRITLLLPYL